MGLTSLQVCMDSSDWLQATIPEEGTTSMGLDSTSSSSPITGDEMLACSRPLLERRLRPEPEQSLKCPRCDSTHTKFCYYNNYSLSQPRYFCKSCRRYWTKGGTLRNIPVGGGCRKTHSKKPSKKSDHHHSPSSLLLSHTSLAFPEQLQFASLHAAAYGTTPPAPYFFDMDQKYEALLAGQEGGFGAPMINPPAILESCQRMMMPYDGNNHMGVEMKPILSLDQQINCNSDDGKDSFWFMNGYGC